MRFVIFLTFLATSARFSSANQCGVVESLEKHVQGIINESNLENFRQTASQQISDLQQADQNLQSQINSLTQTVSFLQQKFYSQPKSTRCYMGMKFGDIADSEISASSTIENVKYSPKRARLDTERNGLDERGGWAAKYPASPREWIQVDLGAKTSVAGVILQGRHDIDEWVKTYEVQCDSTTIKENNGAIKVFHGNWDRNTKVVGKFPSPLNCRYVRIVPKTYKTHATLRFELIRGSCFDEY